MSQAHQLPTWPERLLTLMTGVVILKVTAGVVAGYSNYLPPDFGSDFLRGREPYFPGVYAGAFYTHILFGPIALVLGLTLVSDRFRTRFPRAHRILGRVQVANVLLLVTPSGLVMARHAAAGPIAAVGLAALAVATAFCILVGTRAAMTRRFADHRRWMMRSFLLLSSAVVLRLLGGLAIVTGVTGPWVDPLATWLCWIGPLAVFELRERRSTRLSSRV